MKNKYTSSDIARTLSVNERTARRYIEKHLYIKGNTKYISKDLFDLIINLEGENGQPTDKEEFDIVEGFSEVEYNEFQKRLIEYPLIKKHIERLESEIEYYKFHNAKLSDMIESALKSLQQRNYIEVKEKKLK